MPIKPRGGSLFPILNPRSVSGISPDGKLILKAPDLRENFSYLNGGKRNIFVSISKSLAYACA